MKHTRSISLVVIASLTAVSLSSCAPDVPSPPDLTNQKIYSSVSQCESDKVANCVVHYKNASQNHLLRSPKYVSEDLCIKNGHEKCVDIQLDEATIWLPKMVGFMANDRPVYLKGLSQTTTTVEVEGTNGSVWEEERSLTPSELKEREVVAGGTASSNSIVVLGGWYPTPSYYSRGFSPSYAGILSDGMETSYQRATGSRGSSGSRGTSISRSGSRGVSIRGGFGGRGGSFGGGG